MRFLNNFVDSNDREIRRLQHVVDETNALEAEYEALSDEEIRAHFAELRAEILEVAAPDEPSEDELHHPDLERRRELKKERRKRENDRLQKALDDDPPRGLRDDPRGDEADARDAPLRRPADRRGRPPPGQDRRDADRRGQDPRRAAGRHPQRDWPAAASTSSPSTTTSPAATRSGWARSSTSSASASG